MHRLMSKSQTLICGFFLHVASFCASILSASVKVCGSLPGSAEEAKVIFSNNNFGPEINLVY